MNEFEKLYTVDDIAQMTMLTTRTIRNYLKDGLLKGRKIGGQWRFTAKDIESLFENSSVEEELKNNRRQEVMDFINGVNTDMIGEIQICTIADYYCPDLNAAKLLSDRFAKVINGHTATSDHRYSYEYIDKEQKARYTFFGPPMYIRSVMDTLEEEWIHLNESQSKFTDKAQNYAKYRPSYPVEMIDLIMKVSGHKANTVADIGSGTGKLTKQLLDRGYMVYGIEPNEDMREEAMLQLGDLENFKSLNGTAENTTLKADSIDIITCAEAYHWFDNESTLFEFKRILRPGGYVFLLWNTPGENPYGGELGDLYFKYCRQNMSENISVSKEERALHLFGEGNYQRTEFEHSIHQSFEGLLGGSLSASYAPNQGDDNYIDYVNGVREIFDKYSKDGMIETKFRAVCYYGKL